MTEPRECPDCGATLPPETPAGACPRCLLAVGLESGDEEPPTGPAGREIPAIEEMAAHFPSLELLEPIGHGGMGIVWKARQKALDRLVALKVLWPELGDDPAFAERFTREARALARLDHPNIVRVYESGNVDGLYYLVMDHVDGVNLRDAMEGGALAPAEALAIVPQLCDALQYAHDQGVVHRDIKPANVMLQRDGRVKIADFGLAKLVAGGETDDTLTREGQVMGTLHYMAPEQYKTPNDVDHRADIYSLGVVFYEMLTGEVPIGRFEAPSKKVEIDVRLDGVVLRALAREPDRRYQHASDVKTEVSNITSTEGAAPPQDPEPVPGEGVTFEKTWSSDRSPDARTSRLAVAAFAVVLGSIAASLLGFTSVGPGRAFLVSSVIGGAAMLLGLVACLRMLAHTELAGWPYALTALFAPPVLGCCGLLVLPFLFDWDVTGADFPIRIDDRGVEVGDIKITEDGVEAGPVRIDDRGVEIDQRIPEGVHLSGGPKWMDHADRRNRLRDIARRFAALQRESRRTPPQRLLHEQGEAWYGTQQLGWITRSSAEEFARDLENHTVGLPLVSFDDPAHPPLSKFRITAVRFEDDPDSAQVAAETGRHRIQFGMHVQDGRWYFDARSVQRRWLPEASDRPAGAQHEDASAVLAAWARLVTARRDGPIPRTRAHEFVSAAEAERVSAMTPEEFAAAAEAGELGLPFVPIPADGVPFGDLRVNSLGFHASGVRVRVAGADAWCITEHAFSMRKDAGNWVFETKRTHSFWDVNRPW